MITSRSNPLIQRARACRDGRDDGRALLFIEGLRLCEEALRADLRIDTVLYTEQITLNERGAHLLAALKQVCAQVVPVSQHVLEFISDTKTPQGIVLLADRVPTTAERFSARVGAAGALIVVIHKVNNPTNAGACLRVAEAAGAIGVIATHTSVDLFSPKALRGAMGSSFRLPVWSGVEFREALRWCADQDIRTIGTSLTAERAHTEVDWSGNRAVIIGAEASGLHGEEAALTDGTIRIPMRAPVESLNVAVALGVVLYEAARQRALF